MGMATEEKTYCLEGKAGPVYLGLRPKDNISGDRINGSRLKNYVTVTGTSLHYISAFVKTLTFAENIDRHWKLKGVLQSCSADKLSVFNGFAYSTEKYFEQGYFLGLQTPDSSISDTKHAIEKNGLLGDSPFISISCDGNEIFAQIPTVEDARESKNVFRLYEIPPPPVHPAFVARETNSVYHDIARCYAVLDCFNTLDEVRELREICDTYILKHSETLPLQARKPVIVIEGLDATGKTTLTQNLGVELGATILKSPPECICHLRPKFDSHPQLLRRAFYSLGNYAFASMIADAAENRVVIADRFWNSTAAYAIATDVNAGGAECLPPPGHWVYNWPADLLKPDAVFLLTITDEVRRKRLLGRGTVKTDEEIRLECSSPFRQRLVEAYERMDQPKPQKIDASGTPEEVLEKTIKILKAEKLLQS